jgi:hypothetical protein
MNIRKEEPKNNGLILHVIAIPHPVKKLSEKQAGWVFAKTQ